MHGGPPINFRSQGMNSGHPRSISAISEDISDAPYPFQETAKEFRTHPISFRNQRMNLGHPRLILGISAGIQDIPDQF